MIGVKVQSNGTIQGKSMNTKQQIEADIKTAMLAGDKTLVTTLRGLKSAIMYGEVAAGSRDTGLPEAEVTALLRKEAKKRQESADLYLSANDTVRGQAELNEKEIIEKYLPAQMTEEAVQQLVDQEAAKLGDIGPQQMGQLIGVVKQASNGLADGALIARLVKERLAQ